MRNCPPFHIRELDHADATATFFPSYYIPSREKIYSHLKVAASILLMVIDYFFQSSLFFL
jgi:hypothetical protein